MLKQGHRSGQKNQISRNILLLRIGPFRIILQKKSKTFSAGHTKLCHYGLKYLQILKRNTSLVFFCCSVSGWPANFFFKFQYIPVCFPVYFSYSSIYVTKSDFKYIQVCSIFVNIFSSIFQYR